MNPPAEDLTARAGSMDWSYLFSNRAFRLRSNWAI